MCQVEGLHVLFSNVQRLMFPYRTARTTQVRRWTLLVLLSKADADPFQQLPQVAGLLALA